MSNPRVTSFIKSRLSALGMCLPAAKSGRKFLAGQRGAVAIYFGLSALVFVGVAGLAVDAARGYLIKARLSEAIDAAALAGGKALQNDTDQNHTLVTNDVLAFFRANFPNGAMGANVQDPTISIDNNSASVSVNSTATIPTTLMRLLGFNNMIMTASAKVARAATGLDVVLSFDNSGSMSERISGDTSTKIEQQRDNASDLVDLLAKPFTSGLQQQIVTIQGTQYSLLNIGVVPWAAKVNVKTYTPGSGTPSGTGTVTTGASYTTDPMGRYSSVNTKGFTKQIYFSSNSQVPLLYDPTKIPSGWSGCVYARYNGDTNYDNDADLSLGSVTVGGKFWPGWEPIAKDEGEPQNGSRGNASCDQASWNNNSAVPYPDNSPIPTAWYSLPAGQRHTDECTDCPSVGILPLHSDYNDVKTMIGTLTARGNTDAVQGLFWAYEVLMPGAPFNEAVVSPPFQRAQAIVFMTDGQSVGGNGDAYHGWFGEGEGAASTSAFGTMKLPVYDAACNLSYSNVNNNLSNRMLSMATQIKGCDTQKGGPGQGPIKIYVIQYQQAGQADLTALLSQVATKPTSPYFFQANNGAALKDAFTQIGASLSALRLVQ